MGFSKQDFHPELPNSFIPRRTQGYHIQQTPCCIVLQDINNEDVLNLNDTGLLIWRLCTEAYNVGEIIAMLRDIYPEQQERISRDVYRVLDTFKEYGVIDFRER